MPLLTKSELHAVLSATYASVSGSTLGLYIAFGVSVKQLHTELDYSYEVFSYDSLNITTLMTNGIVTYRGKFKIYKLAIAMLISRRIYKWEQQTNLT